MTQESMAVFTPERARLWAFAVEPRMADIAASRSSLTTANTPWEI